MPHDSELVIALLLPDLLGTYGDTGNAQVLARRARWRGIRCRVVHVGSAGPVPAECDIYLLGGGENVAQAHALQLLDAGGFGRALARAAPVLAVCAGMQLLGTATTDADGRRYGGLGVLDLTTTAGRRRAIGPVVAQATAAAGLADATLVGFENHSGRTVRGKGLAALGKVRSGIGNGDGWDGAVDGHVFGTYLHGPVLARNPALADHLLTIATGRTLPELDMPDVVDLRTRALAGARRGSSRRNRSVT